MQLKQLQDTKESTPGLNDDIGNTIALDEKIVMKKKEEKKNWQNRCPKYYPGNACWSRI